MSKRKYNKNNNKDKDYDDEIVPIPIQFFFWNQSRYEINICFQFKPFHKLNCVFSLSLFIKQKFGSLTEAHALVSFKFSLVKIIM